MPTKLEKTDEEWRKELTPEQYRIMRKKGTDRPFDNEYWDNHEEGVYVCAACGTPLFVSETKFESGSGWPSFYKPLDPERIEEDTDTSFGMRRTEVLCATCEAHLGHLFPDGPEPTGLRYCVNSTSLRFEPKK